eukprot:3594844-Pleurochrysis_carterae.AAC.3
MDGAEYSRFKFIRSIMSPLACRLARFKFIFSRTVCDWERSPLLARAGAVQEVIAISYFDRGSRTGLPMSHPVQCSLSGPSLALQGHRGREGALLAGLPRSGLADRRRHRADVRPAPQAAPQGALAHAA